MIRQLRAFAWLRWRLLLNGVRGSKRRDTIEQISRILALAAPAAIVVFSLGSIFAIGVGGYLAGSILVRGTASAEPIVATVRAVLAAQLLIVVFMPLGMSAQSSARFARLLLLPIHRRVLLFVEVVSGVADPWVFVMLPGLVLLSIAMLLGGGFQAAFISALAGAGLVATLLSLGAFIGFLASWAMRDRRRAELLTLFFVVGISVAALLPHFMSIDAARRQREAKAAGVASEGLTLRRIEAKLPYWTRALPSEMYGQALSQSVVYREPSVALAWTAGLWLQAIFAYLLAGWSHRKLLDAGEGQARRRTAASLAGLPRLPLLSPGASVVAAAQLRTALRSVRGRLAVLLPGPMMGLLALVLVRAPDEAAWIAAIPHYGHLVFGASLIFAIYAVQAFTMNQFASDRAGLTLQLLMPISDRDLVWGKAAGTFGLFGVGAALGFVVTMVTTGGGSPWLWLAVALGGCATFLILTPFASSVSTLLPVVADLSKTGSGGNPHGAAMLAGTVLVLLAGAPSVLILLVVPQMGAPATLGVMAAWLLLVAAVAIPLLSLTAKLVTARRENLYLTK
jgi:hypothetical protein